MENLGRALRDQPGDLDFDILGELGIWGGQGHANLFLYLTAVLECQMFGNMRHCLCLHLLSHGVLSNLGGDGRILHERSVSADVGFVILVDKRFGWLSVEECHVFADWIFWGLIVFRRNQFVCVGDTQHLNHLAVELGQVVDLRGLSGQLHHSLILHDPLRHRAGVGIRDRDHLDHVVIRLLGLAVTFNWIVVVLLRGVVADDLFEQFKLLLH